MIMKRRFSTAALACAMLSLVFINASIAEGSIRGAVLAVVKDSKLV